MSCGKTREFLSSYIDNRLIVVDREACDEHLDSCPVCRDEVASMRAISAALKRTFSSPLVPVGLEQSINRRILIEASARVREPSLPWFVVARRWIRPRLMPYSVGAFASVLLFLGMLVALRPHMRALRDAELANRLADNQFSDALAADQAFYFDITKPVSPAGLAAVRAPFGEESPSLDPRGALAALTFSPSTNQMGDDDMIFVADVFTDGRATLADVVQAPRDKHILSQLQDALRENPAFVPASYDQRPQTLRVVFVFQKVDVHSNRF